MPVQVWALATDAAQQRLIVGSASSDLLVYSMAAARQAPAPEPEQQPAAAGQGKRKKRKGAAAEALLQEEATLAGLQVSL